MRRRIWCKVVGHEWPLGWSTLHRPGVPFPMHHEQIRFCLRCSHAERRRVPVIYT